MTVDIRSAYAHMPFGVVAIDSDGRICDLNTQFTTTIKQNKSDIIGRKIEQVLPNLKLSLLKKSKDTHELKLHNGDTLLISAVEDTTDPERICYLFFENNHIIRYLKHNREKLQIEVILSEETFNALYDGICITDSYGRCLFVNDAFEQLSGIRRTDIIGKSGFDIMESNLQTNSCSEIVVQTGKPTCTIIKYYRGKRCLVTGNPVYLAGKLERVICTVRDLSELQSLEMQLRNTNVLSLSSHHETSFDNNNSTTPLSEALLGDGCEISPAMKEIYEKAGKIAKFDTPVLILGETGVGKDFLARHIHSLAKGGSNTDFVKINCAAIPDNLLESELFGYEPGAFTNAKTNGKIGFLEIARNGTIFLDEIGDMPLYLQVKILDAIQDKQVHRVGGTKPIKIGARIIAATNVDLAQKLEQGNFRRDLYYRLNVISILIPPLRERREDILYFVKHFLNESNQKYEKEVYLLPETLSLFQEYDWPGNIRELRNMIERMVIFVEKDFITSKDFEDFIIRANYYDDDPLIQTSNSSNSMTANPVSSLREQLESYESYIIQENLKIHSTFKEAADALGIDTSTLFRKKAKYNL